ncbi:MAG TPA: tetratricopeptide repeat protein [Bacteroidota bacterium]|nr:tetratricopeptide repeat protein [Bacteroidota bacterium]
MLRKQKKIAQRVVKEDTLLTKYYTTQSWLEENKKRLSTIGLIAAVVILGAWFYVNNARNNNEKAANDLAKVFSYYDNGQYQAAITGLPEKNVPGLQTIVDNYGSTKTGNLAKFYLADAYYNTQQYDKALQLYGDVSAGVDIVDIAAMAGEAACYEAKGDFEKAAKLYEKAGKKSSSDPNAPENLVAAARNYAKKGDKERAVELYKLVKEEYAQSAAARDAERFLLEMNESNG